MNFLSKEITTGLRNRCGNQVWILQIYIHYRFQNGVERNEVVVDGDDVQIILNPQVKKE